MTGETSLDAVRQQIDRIDEAIHDLIIQRTTLVETVRHLKRDAKIKIRPSREAEILYRLVERHRGPFPKRELVAIWRQLMMATLSFEGPFSVAVYMPTKVSGYWDLARDHFGLFTPMTRHTSAHSVIEAVCRQDATVGVLPMPSLDDTDPWWRHIVPDQPDSPRIIARLPFAGRSNGLGGPLDALVICPLSLDATGRDRSFFAVEIGTRIGINQLAILLKQAGLVPVFTAPWREEQAAGTCTCLYLVEVEGFLTKHDDRLAAFRKRFDEGEPVRRIVLLGGYAIPLGNGELGPAVETSHEDLPPYNNLADARL